MIFQEFCFKIKGIDLKTAFFTPEGYEKLHKEFVAYLKDNSLSIGEYKR